MHITSIKETCIYIEDLKLAKSFYADKLGFKVISHIEEKHIFFKVGKSVLLCFNPESSKSKESPPPHYTYGPQHFAFEVPQEKYYEAIEKITSLGIEIIDTVKWPSGLESFYFNDPAGNVLEIVPRGVWD